MIRKGLSTIGITDIACPLYSRDRIPRPLKKPSELSRTQDCRNTDKQSDMHSTVTTIKNWKLVALAFSRFIESRKAKSNRPLFSLSLILVCIQSLQPYLYLILEL